jgi:hypothetical protein
MRCIDGWCQVTDKEGQIVKREAEFLAWKDSDLPCSAQVSCRVRRGANVDGPSQSQIVPRVSMQLSTEAPPSQNSFLVFVPRLSRA